MTGYLPGEAGRAAYAAQVSRNTTPRGDPQRTGTSAADPRVLVAEWMAPCAECGHPGLEHHLPDRGVRRGRCCTGTAAGWCGCARYAPPL